MPVSQVREALTGAGVVASDKLALGGGRYIIQVPKGTEDAAAEALASQRGVFDAGLVYDAGLAK